METNLKKGTTLLRTLSRKSQLKFGVYCDSTVQDLITFRRFNYIRWVYFNCDMISFMDDILDEVGITGSYRIKKPSKCPEKYQELVDEKQSKIPSFTKFKNALHQKKMDRIKHSKIRKMNDKFYTKHRLTLKNQGK
jgi:hypothetical protein